MRSRWAKFFSSRSSTLALALLSFAAHAQARAALTINSFQSTGTNDKFWFAGISGGVSTWSGSATGPTGAAAYPDPDASKHFRILDYAAVCRNGSCDLSNGIEFEVTSDKSNFGNAAGTVTVLVVRVFQSSGSSSQTFAPIAGVNGVPCDGSICATLGQDTGSNGYFLGALFSPGSKLTITILPSDICNYAANPTGGIAVFVPSICSGSSVAAAATQQLFVKFSIIAVPGNSSAPAGANPITAAASLDDGPSTTTLNFQSESPGFDAAGGSCNISGDIEGVYFPGDGQIKLETGRFSMSVNSSNDAPGDAVIVVGQKSATEPDVYLGTLSSPAAVTSALDGTQFPLITRVPYNSGAQGVTGFTNSENASDGNSYSLTFLLRDRAGLVAAPNGTQTCSLTGVRTAEIRGFLREGQCFIATAAFGDYKHGPVAMLRRFRDVILLKSDPGRAFVRWYYDWSPGAAEWLMEHPAFRYPVLLALLPLEAMAWLGLHPPVLGFLALLASILLGSVAYRRMAVPMRRE